MGWIIKLVGLFFGGKSPIDSLGDVYAKFKDSAIEHERLVAQDALSRRNALLQEQQAALMVRLSSMGFWEMRLMTAIVLGQFVIHLSLISIDTFFSSINLGIPKYPAPIDEWEGAIILSLFGIVAAQRSVMSIAAAIATRKR